MLETYVALLRGINVGGKNKLPMKDLADICSEVGCCDVMTYIQSGNVIFQAEAGVAAGLPQKITAQITERFGYRIPVIIRTAAQIKAVLLNNLFLAQGVSEDTLHVMFLADLPSSDQVSALDPNRSTPDTFIVQGQEIYLHLPNGVADTKLINAYFDAKLATTCTSRNWKTVTKLLAMMQKNPALEVPGYS
ncbi:MAG: DUF1697 domain-containing protein [Janthinobacterium lividum]